MVKNFYCCIVIMFIFWMVGCKSYSKYTIDSKPSIKIDTGLLGIWKAVEDTDKANFILIQNLDDAEYKIEEKWRKKNKSYETRDYDYYLTYMHQHGSHPHYRQFTAFLSTVNKSKFLNVAYYYTPYVKGHPINNQSEEGYFFVRLVHLSRKYDTLVTAIVADTTLKYLKSSAEVRERITKNVNNPAFYSDTLHFYKVSRYHARLGESILKANPNSQEK